MSVRSREVNELAVELNVGAGEFLRYELSYSGERASFDLGDKSKTLLSDSDHQYTQGLFRLDWSPAALQLSAGVEIWHQLFVSFAASPEYALSVTKHGADGALKKIVKKCRYTPDAGKDHARVPLAIFLV
jgi:hypothetical protein